MRRTQDKETQEMQDLNGNTLSINAGGFAVATPILFLDQDKPAPKSDGDGKKKPKPAPAPDRKLSDFEMEAIKRIAKLDPRLARKLGAKLPKKRTVAELVAYIRKRIGKVDDERKILEGLSKDNLTKEKGLAKAIKRLDQIEEELRNIGLFHIGGILPKWYRKLLEERKKQKKKDKAPTSKPADKTPGSRPTGSFRLTDGLLVNLLAA